MQKLCSYSRVRQLASGVGVGRLHPPWLYPGWQIAARQRKVITTLALEKQWALAIAFLSEMVRPLLCKTWHVELHVFLNFASFLARGFPTAHRIQRRLQAKLRALPTM